MFEELAKTFSEQMLGLSKGKLHCLPYSRALLDFFEARGTAATPLVVRGVVFGRLEPSALWQKLDIPKMANAAITGPRANAGLVVEYATEVGAEPKKLTVPYRTIGLPHSEGDGDKTLGNYQGGAWLGHLVVVADNTLIDLTIGQLNDKTFGISFNPTYVTVETDEKFLAGKSLLIGEQDGSVVCYCAFPNERTYEASDSWKKPELRQQLKIVADRVVKLFEGSQPSGKLRVPSKRIQAAT